MRWIVLAGALLMQTCLGSIYAWSAFTPALQRDHGLTAGQAGLLFGLAIAVFTSAMVFAGRLQDRYGPRPVATAAAVLFAAGYLTASASAGSFPVLLLGLGALVGLGTGFGYVGPLAACVAWFPRRKGLITGLAVAGFGGGAILLSEAVRRLLGAYSVLEVLGLVGVVYGAIIAVAAQALGLPGGQASRTQPVPAQSGLAASTEFRACVTGMFAGTFGGLLVVGNLTSMASAAGLSADAGIAGVQAFAAGNAAGRIGWGWLYDRFGRVAIPASLVVLAIAINALAGAGSAGTFVATAALVGFGFGACFVVYAAQTVAVFGQSRFGGTYPLVFLAYGFSGLVAPACGGAIHDATGSFGPGIVLATVLLVAAVARVAGRSPLTARQEVSRT